jgi:hypothetical protein
MHSHYYRPVGLPSSIIGPTLFLLTIMDMDGTDHRILDQVEI